MSSAPFLFTSESVGEGHPGRETMIHFFIFPFLQINLFLCHDYDHNICGFLAEWLRCKDSDKASNSDFDPRCETIDDLFCSISQGRKEGRT